MHSFSFLVLASHPLPRESILETLESVTVGGLWIAGIKAFAVTLGFSLLWLLWGRISRWDSSHYAVPILLWCLQAELRTVEYFFPVSHPMFLLVEILEGLSALTVVLAMIWVGYASRPQSVARSSRMGWSLSVAALAFVTIVADWIFILLLIVPILDRSRLESSHFVDTPS